MPKHCIDCCNFRSKDFTKKDKDNDAIFTYKIKKIFKRYGKVSLCWCKMFFLKNSFYILGKWKKLRKPIRNLFGDESSEKFVINGFIPTLEKPKKCNCYNKPLEAEEAGW